MMSDQLLEHPFSRRRCHQGSLVLAIDN